MSRRTGFNFVTCLAEYKPLSTVNGYIVSMGIIQTYKYLYYSEGEIKPPWSYLTINTTKPRIKSN